MIDFIWTLFSFAVFQNWSHFNCHTTSFYITFSEILEWISASYNASYCCPEKSLETNEPIYC